MNFSRAQGILCLQTFTSWCLMQAGASPSTYYVVEIEMSAPLEPDSDPELTLAAAAKRLRCHVETLRVRVRKGKLRVRRGPHGVYLVRQSALSAMRPIRRPPAPLDESLDDLDFTWASVENDFRWYFRLGAPELKLLELVRQHPTFNRRFYRLATVWRLRYHDYTTGQIAQLLGISDRQVRRLKKTKLLPAAKKVVQALREQPMSKTDARQVMAQLRERLVARGLQPHERTVWLKEGTSAPKRKRVAAIRTYRLTKDEFMALDRAGVTREEMVAIYTVGIATDDLHELLVMALEARR